jgi:hypothetical protein
MMSRLVVKNTFLDIDEEGEASPNGRSQRKYKTAGAALVNPAKPAELEDEDESPVAVVGAPEMPSLFGRPFLNQSSAAATDKTETATFPCTPSTSADETAPAPPPPASKPRNQEDKEGCQDFLGGQESVPRKGTRRARKAALKAARLRASNQEDKKGNQEDKEVGRCLAGKSTFLNIAGTEVTPVRRSPESKTETAAAPGSSTPSEKVSDEEECPAPPPDRAALARQLLVAKPASTPQELEDYADILTAQIEAGGEALAAALATMRPYVLGLSFDRVGCRVVQLAFDRARTGDAVQLAEAFRGHVRSAILSPHANHVIQKIIQRVPAPSLKFLAEELKGAANFMVHHRYGCRILCRLAEFDAEGEDTLALFAEVLAADVVELCDHDYGHYFVKQIMECGPPHLRARFVRALAAEGDLVRCAKQRNFSQVIESSLRHGSPEEREIIAAILLGNASGFGHLVCHVYGVRVARALLQLPPGPMAYRAMACLQRAATCARTRKGRYQQLLLEVGMGLPPPV